MRIVHDNFAGFLRRMFDALTHAWGNVQISVNSRSRNHTDCTLAHHVSSRKTMHEQKHRAIALKMCGTGESKSRQTNERKNCRIYCEYVRLDERAQIQQHEGERHATKRKMIKPYTNDTLCSKLKVKRKNTHQPAMINCMQTV